MMTSLLPLTLLFSLPLCCWPLQQVSKHRIATLDLDYSTFRDEPLPPTWFSLYGAPAGDAVCVVCVCSV